MRVIQLDIAQEEIGTNVPTEVALVGDAKAVIGQLNAVLDEHPWQFSEENTWRTTLQKKIDENIAKTEPLLADDTRALNKALIRVDSHGLELVRG